MPEFRIVVAAHGDFAEALLAAAKLICGQLPDVLAVGLGPDDSPESFNERFMTAAGDPDRPLLVLTDLAGGTPHNVALAATRHLPNAVLVSGINLAILLEAAMSDDALDSAFVERLVENGRDAIVLASRLLATRPL